MTSPFLWRDKPAALSEAIKPSPKARKVKKGRRPYGNPTEQVLRARHGGIYSKAGMP